MSWAIVADVHRQIAVADIAILFIKFMIQVVGWLKICCVGAGDCHADFVEFYVLFRVERSSVF